MIICLLLLTGCWDRKELSDIGIVAAMAIDKDPETGEYVLTSQYLRPSAESTQTPTPERPYLLVSTTGNTIAEVMRKANRTIDRKSFYSHNHVIIVSEELAREGVLPLFDAFPRGKEVRGYVWLAIARDIPAKDLLEIKGNNIARIPANFLEGLFENAEHDAISHTILDYYKRVLGEGIDPVAAVLTREETEIEPFELVQLLGGAAFKEDKLVGFISESDTRGFNWVTGEGPKDDRGVINIPSLIEEVKTVTLLMKKVESTIKPTAENQDQISFTIDVKQKATMSGQEAVAELTEQKEIIAYLNKLEEAAEKKIEQEIISVIDKAQQEFQADIFGFGSALNRANPKVWKQVKNDWSERFSEIAYTVNVEVEIQNTGLLKGE